MKDQSILEAARVGLKETLNDQQKDHHTLTMINANSIRLAGSIQYRSHDISTNIMRYLENLTHEIGGVQIEPEGAEKVAGQSNENFRKLQDIEKKLQDIVEEVKDLRISRF